VIHLAPTLRTGPRTRAILPPREITIVGGGQGWPWGGGNMLGPALSSPYRPAGGAVLIPVLLPVRLTQDDPS